MSAKSNNPRLAAVRALAQIVDNDQPLDAALNKLVGVKEKAWLQEILYGGCRWYFRLEALTALLLDRPLKERDHDIHLLILLGLYELFYMETGAHATVNETVAVSRLLGKNWASGLVNACLRRAQRERESLEQQIDENVEARFSHPLWLVTRLQQQYPDAWQAILEANNQRPPLHVRVNRRLNSRKEYLERLSKAGLAAEPLAHCSDGIALIEPVPVNRLPGFEQGRVSVQDGAAQLTATLLDLQPDQRVLDACAAPGGKGCHILEHQPELQRLVMVENSTSRARRIDQNLARLGLSAEVCIADARETHWWDGQPFQRVLLDAPCSATGVIRRHPDIKLHRTPDQVESAVRLQGKLLDSLWPLLESGGKLLYATCSVLAEENENQVAGFLERHNDATEIPLDLPWAQQCTRGRQILPGTSGLDGFYYACIQKK